MELVALMPTAAFPVGVAALALGQEGRMSFLRVPATPGPTAAQVVLPKAEQKP